MSGGPPREARAITVADLLTLRHGDTIRLTDGTMGEIAFCAPSGSYAPGFSVTGWPPERYDGLMIHDEVVGLMFFDLAGFEKGEVWWVPGDGAP